MKKILNQLLNYMTIKNVGLMIPVVLLLQCSLANVVKRLLASYFKGRIKIASH